MKTCLVLLLATAIAAAAGDAVRYEAVRGDVKVRGTSTLHDWTVHSGALAGWIEAPSGFPQTAGVANVKIELTVPAASLKSHKESMDEVMYKALDESACPDITYRLVEAHVRAGETNGLVLDTAGELNVACHARELKAEVRVDVRPGGELLLTGSVPLKMTDFSIEPPRALAGMIRSGDAVTVDFEWLLKTTDGEP
jgi:hypothetical protein